MTLSTTERPSRLAAVDVRRWIRLAVAIVLGIASCASTFLVSDADDWRRWVPLLIAAPIVIWGAWPIHLAAARSILASRLSPDVLASLAILAATAQAIHATTAQESNAHLVPVALGSVLLIAAYSHTADSALVWAWGPRWLTPVVLLIAAGTLAAWWRSDDAASAALSVLLIAAPGALRIAEPAAQLTGARRAAEAGISLHDPAAFGAAQRITTIVLDKDGTVTTGALSVMTVDPVEPEHLRNLRWFAGALAHSSDHPVAKAIAKLSGRGHVAGVVHEAGRGLSGSVDRHPVRVGTPAWFGLESTVKLGIESAVEVDGRFLGRITVGDTLRPHASDGVAELRGLGLDLILVSDLPEAETSHVADQSQIDVRHPDLGDPERLALVEQLRARGEVVAVVGAPDLNRSALDAADLPLTLADSAQRGIGLASLDISSVHDSIVLARATAVTATANRWGALVGMLAPLPCAAAGLIPPLYAPIIAAACMLGVAINSARIPRARPPKT